MKRELNFWVLGGDLRQACLARLLAEDGHRVHTYALSGSVVTPTENLTLADSLDGIGRADCVVLPLPVAGAEGMVNTPLTRSALPLASLLDALSPPQILCGGRVDPVSAAMADARGLILRDYFAREELAVANAVPTAEGAVQLAMEQMPVTIHGARVLITGVGRGGQAAARRFAWEPGSAWPPGDMSSWLWRRARATAQSRSAVWTAGCAATIWWSTPSPPRYWGRRN